MNTLSAAENLSWHSLQEKLRECKTEAEVELLIIAEKAGSNRLRWIKRMTGRLRALRAERENAEFLAASTNQE